MKMYLVITWLGHQWEIKARTENGAWRAGCDRCGPGDHIVELRYIGKPEGALNAQ